MKKFQVKSALLTLLAVSFVALFAVGCGNSREDFVITGNNNAATTGNLLFRFQQQATAQQIVPAGTTSLRFDLFSGNPPTSANFVETRTVPYADEVVLTDVPSNVTTVTVTAFQGDIPTEVYQGSGIVVVVAGTTEVQFDSEQPITLDSVAFTPDPTNLVSDGTTEGTQQLSALLTFSNGTQVAGTINNTTTSCSFDALAFAEVSPTGLITQDVVGDNATLTCTYTLPIGNQSATDSIFVSSFGFMSSPDGGATLTPTGGYNGGWTTRFEDDDNFTVLANVTANSTFALGTGAPSNLSIDADTGVITNSGTTPAGTDVDVIITWVDGRTGGTGLTFTDTVTLSVPNNS